MYNSSNGKTIQQTFLDQQGENNNRLERERALNVPYARNEDYNNSPPFSHHSPYPFPSSSPSQSPPSRSNSLSFLDQQEMSLPLSTASHPRSYQNTNQYTNNNPSNHQGFQRYTQYPRNTVPVGARPPQQQQQASTYATRHNSTSSMTDTRLSIPTNTTPNPPLSYPIQATLFFGGVLNPNSLTGGCAWSLIDSNNRRIAHGSYSVVQDFPSLIRLEYEGLLNGLQACLLKNLLSIHIKSCSGFSVYQYTHPERPYTLLSSIYHAVYDLNNAINKVLPRFKHYECYTIPKELNGFVFKLSIGAITTHIHREQIKLEKFVCITDKYTDSNARTTNVERHSSPITTAATSSMYDKHSTSNMYTTNNITTKHSGMYNIHNIPVIPIPRSTSNNSTGNIFCKGGHNSDLYSSNNSTGNVWDDPQQQQQLYSDKTKLDSLPDQLSPTSIYNTWKPPLPPPPTHTTTTTTNTTNHSYSI